MCFICAECVTQLRVTLGIKENSAILNAIRVIHVLEDGCGKDVIQSK